VLGSQALESILTTLHKRIAGFDAQSKLAASTDFPRGAPAQRRKLAGSEC
jgi:hypothetical protein